MFEGIKLQQFYQPVPPDEENNASTIPLPHPRRRSRALILGVIAAGLSLSVLLAWHAPTVIKPLINKWPTLQDAQFELDDASDIELDVGLDIDERPHEFPSDQDDDDRPVRIHYKENPGLNERDSIFPPDCPIPVLFTTDEQSADIVIYNSDANAGVALEETGTRETMRQRRPYQRLALWGVESAANRDGLEWHHNMLAQGRQNETFDYEMTYRLDSDIPSTYAYGYFNFENPPLPWEQKRQDRLVSAFVSNCHPKNARTLILKELMRLLPGEFDSFGSCENNADAESTLRALGRWEQTGSGHTWWNVKITTASMYKFSIAMENSNVVDYVTEKYFQSMEIGSIPIHLGTPTFSSSFRATSESAIDLADYVPTLTNLSTAQSTAPEALTHFEKAGLARLAERLRFLGSEEGRTEYEKAWAWKKDPKWKESPFGQVAMLSHLPYSSDCRLAGLLRGKQWGRSGWTAPPGRPTHFNR